MNNTAESTGMVVLISFSLINMQLWQLCALDAVTTWWDAVATWWDAVAMAASFLQSSVQLKKKVEHIIL